MKNSLIRKILSVCLTGLLLSGCDSAKAGAEGTVNRFWGALEKGEIDSAEQYVENDVISGLEDLNHSFSGIDELSRDYDANADTKEKIDTAMKGITASIFKSHTIQNSEKVSDTEYTVSAEITMLDQDQANDALGKISFSDFLPGIQKEAQDTYNREGQDAANQFVLTSLADYITKETSDALKDVPEKTLPCTMTVTRSADTWKITALTFDS
jgi:hypothetical protein